MNRIPPQPPKRETQSAEEYRQHRAAMAELEPHRKKKPSKVKELTGEDIVNYNEDLERFVATGGKQ